jgi:hypothetical protein
VIYTYEIADHGTMIFEYGNDELIDGWPMSMLRQEYVYTTESFRRIQKWIMNNHAELLL